MTRRRGKSKTPTLEDQQGIHPTLAQEREAVARMEREKVRREGVVASVDPPTLKADVERGEGEVDCPLCHGGGMQAWSAEVPVVPFCERCEGRGKIPAPTIIRIRESARVSFKGGDMNKKAEKTVEPLVQELTVTDPDGVVIGRVNVAGLPEAERTKLGDLMGTLTARLAERATLSQVAGVVSGTNEPDTLLLAAATMYGGTLMSGQFGNNLDRVANECVARVFQMRDTIEGKLRDEEAAA